VIPAAHVRCKRLISRALSNLRAEEIGQCIWFTLWDACSLVTGCQSVALGMAMGVRPRR
jgi:hypothetical protein